MISPVYYCFYVCVLVFLDSSVFYCFFSVYWAFNGVVVSAPSALLHHEGWRLVNVLNRTVHCTILGIK